MSCKDKEKFSTSEASTKASLRTNGIIDQFLNILDTNAFRKKNKAWSANARERFGITGNLFLEEDNKAIPNSSVFKQIDLAKGKTYQGILESKSNFENLVLNTADQAFGIEETNQPLDDELKVDFKDDVQNILFNGEIKDTTAQEVLTNIINSNLYENNSQMKTLINKLLISTKAEVKIVSKLKNTDTYMQYNAENNTIEVSPDTIGAVNSVEEGINKFIHEVYHDRTLKILNRPKNSDEVKLVHDITTYYNQVKNSLFKDYPHETSSVEEFTAGMFSNKEFQFSVNEQLDSQENFWNKLIKYFKNLFGLDNSYNKLLDKLVQLVDVTDESFTSTEIFESKYNYGRAKEKEKNQLAKIEDRIDRVIDVLVLQSNRNNSKSKFNKQINVLNKQLENAATTLGKETNEYQKFAINNFVDFMSGQLHAIQSSFAKADKAIDSKEFLYSKAYIQSFISIQDSIKDSLKELKDNQTLTESEYSDTLHKVNQLRGVATTLREDLIFLGKNAIKNSDYIAKEYKETVLNYTRLYREQGKKEGLKGAELEEYVNKEVASNRQLIQGDTHREFSEMLDEAITDISAVSTWFNSEKDFTHPIIRMFSSILDKVKDKYENLIQNQLLDIQKKTSKFLEGKGSTSSDSNYKNLVEWNKDGVAFLKSEYKIAYADKVNQLKDAYEFAENEQDKIKAFQAYQEWYTENTVYDEKLKQRIPHPKWKNDLSTLSPKEKEYLDYVMNLAQETNKLYDIDYKSLKKTTLFADYYKLPSVRKETITTIKSGELGQTAVEWYKEKFTKQSDDTEFGENLNPNEDTYKVYTDLAGKEINYIPIHYRQQIDKKHQSIDLATIYSLEFQNATKFKEKNQVANDLVMFKEVIQEGKFTKKVGFGARVISSVYDKNNLPIEYSKEDVNLIKMLDTVLKTRLYDKTSEYAGKIAGQDVNKLESFVRSTVSGSSMALNLIGAPANWITGKNQSFLEVVRDPNLKKSNLLKAEKYYTSNIGGMMDDLGRNVYKSLPNQLLLSFGGLVSSQMLQNSFEKGKALSLLSHGKPLYFFQEAPEHHIQAVHTMTILDSAKILDKDGNYLDKDGNITSKETAVSLLDISVLEDGILTTSIKTPFYTTLDRLNEYNKEGKGNVRSYIQSSLIKSQGNYGTEYTAELQRKFYGKALFHFKKHVISPTLSRWRGIATNLSEDESKIILNYDYDLQRPDEGNYVTTLRFIKNVFLPKLKGLQMSLLQENWREMDDWEKANIKRTLTEVSMALAMMSLAMLFAGAAKAKGGDDDALWYAASVFRRLQSEQTQYFDVTETWRIANNPISTLNLLQDTASFGSATLNLFNPFAEDRLEHLGKKSLKMTKYIPGSKLFKESKDSYNYMNRN